MYHVNTFLRGLGSSGVQGGVLKTQWSVGTLDTSCGVLCRGRSISAADRETLNRLRSQHCPGVPSSTQWKWWEREGERRRKRWRTCPTQSRTQHQWAAPSVAGSCTRYVWSKDMTKPCFPLLPDFTINSAPSRTHNNWQSHLRTTAVCSEQILDIAYPQQCDLSGLIICHIVLFLLMLIPPHCTLLHWGITIPKARLILASSSTSSYYKTCFSDFYQ